MFLSYGESLSSRRHKRQVQGAHVALVANDTLNPLRLGCVTVGCYLAGENSPASAFQVFHRSEMLSVEAFSLLLAGDVGYLAGVSQSASFPESTSSCLAYLHRKAVIPSTPDHTHRRLPSQPLEIRSER
jgi:hypothetical protein